jgi:CBS domain-containing protein
MEINNMKKLDLDKLASGNLKSAGILKSELNVGEGMEKIMVLKPEEIKEIIKKMEEFYKKWEGVLSEGATGGYIGRGSKWG